MDTISGCWERYVGIPPGLHAITARAETLRLLVENARQLEEGSGVVIDGDGQEVTE